MMVQICPKFHVDIFKSKSVKDWTDSLIQNYINFSSTSKPKITITSMWYGAQLYINCTYVPSSMFISSIVKKL